MMVDDLCVSLSQCIIITTTVAMAQAPMYAQITAALDREDYNFVMEQFETMKNMVEKQNSEVARENARIAVIGRVDETTELLEKCFRRKDCPIRIIEFLIEHGANLQDAIVFSFQCSYVDTCRVVIGLLVDRIQNSETNDKLKELFSWACNSSVDPNEKIALIMQYNGGIIPPIRFRGKVNTLAFLMQFDNFCLTFSHFGLWFIDRNSFLFNQALSDTPRFQGLIEEARNAASSGFYRHDYQLREYMKLLSDEVEKKQLGSPTYRQMLKDFVRDFPPKTLLTTTTTSSNNVKVPNTKTSKSEDPNVEAFRNACKQKDFAEAKAYYSKISHILQNRLYALDTAVRNGGEQIVGWILEQEGINPIDGCCKCFYYACSSVFTVPDRDAVIRLLLKKGAGPLGNGDHEPIILAVVSGEFDSLKRVIGFVGPSDIERTKQVLLGVLTNIATERSIRGYKNTAEVAQFDEQMKKFIEEY